MKQPIRKLMSLLLVVMLVFSGIPAFAAESDGPALGMSTITGFDALADQYDPLDVERGTVQADIPFPQSLRATLLPEGGSPAPYDVPVSAWNCAEGYDPDKGGHLFAFAPVLDLPDDVVLGTGVEAPVINVQVESTGSIIRDLRITRIDQYQIKLTGTAAMAGTYQFLTAADSDPDSTTADAIRGADQKVSEQPAEVGDVLDHTLALPDFTHTVFYITSSEGDVADFDKVAIPVYTGDFVVTGGDSADSQFDSDVLTILTETPLTIRMEEGITATAHTIAVDADVTADLTIQGLNIDSSSGCALELKSGAELTLTLVDDNALKSGGNYAGLQVPDDAALTIQGDGRLSAQANGFGAGIGGGRAANSGEIRITGGEITAYSAVSGKSYGAGIGGGGSESHLVSAGSSGSIAIENATVTAYSAFHSESGANDGFGAGIGGGGVSNLNVAGGEAGTITIKDATVYAYSAGGTGRACGAGIGGGGGGFSSTGGSATEINITNSSIEAISSKGSGYGYGAGIGGGGAYTDKQGGDGGAITIRGGVVHAYSAAESSGSGAGIGGGNLGNGISITIVDAVVDARSSKSDSGNGFGIGSGGMHPTFTKEGGKSGDGGTITIQGGTVTAYAGATSGGRGNGIGAFTTASGVIPTKVTITGGSVIAKTRPDDYTLGIHPMPVDADDNPIYLLTATMYNQSSAAVTSLTGLGSYNIDGLQTDSEGKVFLWLPEGEIAGVTATVNGKLLEPQTDPITVESYNSSTAILAKYSTLTVVNGSGSGRYYEDQVVSISADTSPDGKEFEKWTATAGTLGDANRPYTSFTMPGEDATVTAVYEGEQGGTDKTLASIAITTPPLNTVYTEGQAFDRTGMVVTATYTDGSQAAVSGYTVSPSGALPAGTTSVAIQYTLGGITKAAVQPVMVKSQSAVLASISITAPPAKTVYAPGESFDRTGMVVTAYYSDGNSIGVNNYTLSPSGALPAGTTSVEIRYSDDGVTKTATQPITVSAGSERSSSDSRSGGGSSPAPAAAPSRWLEPNPAQSLAGSATGGQKDLVRTRLADVYGVRKDAWQNLKGHRYSHDTMDGATVQVRLTIEAPERMTQDLYVSGWVKGAIVEKRKTFFEKWFANPVQVVHMDQTGSWGQAVWIAAKVDLADMDPENLFLYSYDVKENQYARISADSDWIDKNGYLHFSTEWAGDYIISKGPLERK